MTPSESQQEPPLKSNTATCNGKRVAAKTNERHSSWDEASPHFLEGPPNAERDRSAHSRLHE
jgi:hypothetical protein